MRTRRATKLAAAVAIAWAATIGGTGTASADVWGPAAFPTSSTDAKWDEGTTDVLAGGRTGNIVGFWQAYLESYNQLGNCGITGNFNYWTSVGTQNMQSFLGVPVDGVVGGQTWNAASRFMFYSGSSATYDYWYPAYAADVSAATYYQLRSGMFAGYWYWSSGRTSPANTLFTSGNGSGVSFAPGPC